MTTPKTWDHEVHVLDIAPHGPLTSLNCCTQCPPRAKLLATHVASYRYVAGRSGRETTAKRRLCPAHARTYCEARGFVYPDLPYPDPNEAPSA